MEAEEVGFNPPPKTPTHIQQTLYTNRYMEAEMDTDVFYYMEGDSVPLAAGWLAALVSLA
jgi:hypothetical protein